MVGRFGVVTTGTAPAWHPAYRAAREGAACFALEDASLVVLTGADRKAYLNDLCTNAIVDLEAGGGRRAFFLNPTKGRTLADFLACETGDALWLECRGGSGGKVLEILRKYYFGQDVEFEDRSGGWVVLALQGPGTRMILEAAELPVPPDLPGSHVAIGGGPAAGRVVRWSDTGEEGVHLWLPTEGGEAVRAALAEAGAVPGTREAWTVLQIEAGVAAFGRELTEEVIPLEAPTGEAIRHDKGCYPGQEVIARLHVRGRPARHLRGLRIAGSLPAPGAVLDAEDKPGAATVTASGVSPELGPVALAYVHRDYCASGTLLTAEGTTATVADLPLR